MSDPKTQPILGLGDTAFDPDIVTKEIDHDFFDDPPMATDAISNGQLSENLKSAVMGRKDSFEPSDEGTCQLGDSKNVMPNMQANHHHQEHVKEFGGEWVVNGTKGDLMQAPTSEPDCNNEGRLDKSILSKHYYGVEENGEHHEQAAEEESSENRDQMSGRSSNVTVHLEMGKEQDCPPASDFYTMESNATSPNYPRPKQCYQLQQRRKSVGSIKKCNGSGQGGALGIDQFQPMNGTDCGLTGNFEDLSSSSSNSSSSDDGLSDSSESELESLDSDDEEFVDMLEKYFDYIDQDSDCSDLTEVSPLSSLTASPLPQSFLTDNEPMVDNGIMKVETERLCSAADGLQICQDDFKTDSRFADVNFAVGGVDFMGMKPKLPLIISTTETVVIGESGKSDEDNVPDNANSKVEGQELCLDCCIQTARKVLSREASPSRKGNGFIAPADDEDRSTSCGSANSSMSISRDDSSRSSSSSWSNPCNAAATAAGKGGRGSSSTSGSSGTSFGSAGSKRPARNYTFTPDQMRKIERENHILLRKILDTHKGHHARTCYRNGHHRTLSSTSLTRFRHQKKIEHENAILMKRLQTVKPSKEIGDAFKPV